MEQKLPIGTIVSMHKTKGICTVAGVNEWEEDTFGQGKYLYRFDECNHAAYASEFTVMSIPNPKGANI